MSFRTPVKNPGTRPPRSRVFDIACTLLAAPASFVSLPSQAVNDTGGASRAPPLTLSLVVAVLTAAVPAQWPVRTELFQVALAISLYTVAVTMSRITAFVAVTLAAAVGQTGWLAAIYEVDRGSGYKTGTSPAKRAAAQERPRQNWLFCAARPTAPLHQ
jgi:hypothetical protein